MVNKRVRNAILGCNPQNDRMISVCFQDKPFNITVIQVYAPTVMLKKLKLNGSMKTYKTFWTNIQKRCPFHYSGLECKSRISRDTWSNRQIWPWSTKRSRSKANRVLPREHIDHRKCPLPTTQEKTLHMNITRWSIQNQIDYILCSQDGQALYSQQKQDRELTGSDQEHLIAKFKFKLKKVGKTIIPFRYDLNQIPYNYTVEVTNRFKGLDLIDRVPKNYGQRFMTLYRRQQ